MTRLDYEKDRRRRLPRDPCPDLMPATVPMALPASKRVRRNRGRVSVGATRPPVSKPPSSSLDVADRLEAMARELSGPAFANRAPAEKLRVLADFQRRLNLAVDQADPGIKGHPAYSRAAAACRRELLALSRDSRL